MPQVLSSKARYGLHLAIGDDGVYRVTVNSVVRFESPVLAAAQIEFDETAYSLSGATREASGRELADFATRGMLAKGNQAKAARGAGKAAAKADSGSVLLAVLANPPSATSGIRTRRRLELAARILGHEHVVIVNVFNCPTPSVLDIAALGSQEAPWSAARLEISAGLESADAVLLGWGTTEPIGSARYHHREQVAWLRSALADRRQIGWTVGGVPRHPSRWQRFTHRHFPDLEFEEALARALRLDSARRS